MDSSLWTHISPPSLHTKTSSQGTGETWYFPITKQRCFVPSSGFKNAAQHVCVWHLNLGISGEFGGFFPPPQFSSVPALVTPRAPANFSQPKLWFCASFYQNRSIFSISSTVLHTIYNAVVLQLLNSNLWNKHNTQNSIKTYKTIPENPRGKTDSQVLLLRNLHDPTLVKTTWLLQLKFWLLHRIKAINKSSITAGHIPRQNPKSFYQLLWDWIQTRIQAGKFLSLVTGTAVLSWADFLLSAATLLTLGFIPNNSLPWLISVSIIAFSFSVC